MAIPTIVCGLILVLIGGVGYLNQDPNATKSLTALIPAFFGGLLILCGVLSLKDNLRKHVMHLAAMLGLFGIVGGFMPLFRQASKIREATPGLSFSEAWGQVDWLKISAISGWSMSLVSFVFVVLCVRSFLLARKAREEAAQQAAMTKATANANA